MMSPTTSRKGAVRLGAKSASSNTITTIAPITIKTVAMMDFGCVMCCGTNYRTRTGSICLASTCATIKTPSSQIITVILCKNELISRCWFEFRFYDINANSFQFLVILFEFSFLSKILDLLS